MVQTHGTAFTQKEILFSEIKLLLRKSKINLPWRELLWCVFVCSLFSVSQQGLASAQYKSATLLPHCHRLEQPAWETGDETPCYYIINLLWGKVWGKILQNIRVLYSSP